jgi:hypothetical protein
MNDFFLNQIGRVRNSRDDLDEIPHLNHRKKIIIIYSDDEEPQEQVDPEYPKTPEYATTPEGKNETTDEEYEEDGENEPEEDEEENEEDSEDEESEEDEEDESKSDSDEDLEYSDNEDISINIGGKKNWLSEDLERLLKHEDISIEINLRKLYDRHTFFTRVRKTYLEWCWSCGQESASQVLKQSMLKDLVCKAADLSYTIPSIRNTDNHKGKCWACRRTRILTKKLLDTGIFQGDLYLGADCAEKLERVFSFVRSLRNMISAKNPAKKDIAKKDLLSTLDDINVTQEKTWRKYE